MPNPGSSIGAFLKAAVLSAAFLAFPKVLFAEDRMHPAPECTDTVRVLVLGDLMMHTRQLSYDSREFLRDLEPLIAGADLAIGGAEFTLAGPPYQGYPTFSSPDSYAENLRAAGIDVLLAANNHILDHGPKGLIRTMKHLGEPWCGVGADSASFASHNPLFVRVRGIRLALVNFTYGTNLGSKSLWPRVSRMKEAEVAEQMRRAAEADFTLVLPHWGIEYELRHCPEQEQWAGRLAEWGAGAIVGSHPHVVQDTTFIGDVPVVYSLGNAVSNMSAPNTRLALAAVLPLVQYFPSGEVKALCPELHFLWCTLPGKLTNGYRTIEVEKYIGRRELWKDPSDYDNMIATYEKNHHLTGK